MMNMAQTMELSEVRRRVPTLKFIDDRQIREQTAKITARAPDYFWEVPASTSGFHNPLCRQHRGLWIHTLMLSTAIERLADSRRQLGWMSQYEIDLAHSAAILHDQRKNGLKTDPSDTSVSDHDLLMADIVRSTALDDRVADAIESHMGPWYDGPEPDQDDELDRLLHDVDMISSTESINPAVQGPAPEEITYWGLHEVDLS